MDIKAISVEELNKYIKDKLDNDEYLNNVLVKGEISNCKLHYTGHIYFTLKDEKSLIKCIMFKSYAAHLSFVPKDGTKVQLFGSVQVFERDGVYQIYAKAMKEDGIGTLHEQFEKLKKKLELEGLFNQEHKKNIPEFPKIIGVLTSSTGSVIRDIINVSTRRNPNVYIRLLPVPVQGPGACDKIAEAIKYMNEEKLADVLIVARGGGSLEDLWPFNQEVVARAIYDSEIPVISAVGHETDFSISDFVADLRAPTPSAAAELAVPNIDDVKYTIEQYENQYKVLLKRKVQLMRAKFDMIMENKSFKNPLLIVENKTLLLDKLEKEIIDLFKNIIQRKEAKFNELVVGLDALSPLKTLLRGYSIVEKNDNVVKSVSDLNIGDNIKIILNDGNVNANIIQIGVILWQKEVLKREC